MGVDFYPIIIYPTPIIIWTIRVDIRYNFFRGELKLAINMRHFEKNRVYIY
jgi:hypothetical protein